MAAQSGSSSWRTRLRTNAGSVVLRVADRAPGPRRHTDAWVSARRRPSSGWRGPGAMPARPSAPAPRSRLTRTVSAWSSMVCPVAAPSGQDRQAGRHVPAPRGSGRAPPPPTAARRGTEPVRRLRHDVGLRRRALAAGRGPRGRPSRGSRPRWPAPAAPASQGHPRRRRSTGVPAGGNVQRVQQVGDEGGERRGLRGVPPLTPPARATQSPGRGSPRAWAASRAPPRPGSAGPGPPAASTASTNRSPSAYWRILASSPRSLEISLVSPRASCGARGAPGRSGRRRAPRRPRPGPW